MLGVFGETIGTLVGYGVPVGYGVSVGEVVVAARLAAGDDCGAAGIAGEAPLLHPPAKPASINIPKSTRVFSFGLSGMAICGPKTLRSGAAQQECIPALAPPQMSRAGDHFGRRHGHYGKLKSFKMMIDTVRVSPIYWTNTISFATARYRAIMRGITGSWRSLQTKPWWRRKSKRWSPPSRP